MTDEAIGSAPAAPASEPASVSAPAPASSTPSSEPSAPSGRRFEESPGAALDRAFDALDITDGDEPATTRAERARDEAGRFAPADPNAKPQQGEPGAETPPAPGATKFSAPERFSADAKAAWESAPEPVKAEVNRAITELTSGIERYKQDFEPYRALDQQLKANGQNFQEVFNHYTGMEALLARDPVAGLDQICRNLGMTLEDVAAHVLNQPVDQRSAQSNRVVTTLQQELAQVKAQLNHFTQSAEQQALSAAQRQVAEFAAAHPRMDELSGDVKFFLETGKAETLEQAYQLAERLNPAPASAAPVQTQPAAQTRQARASITGAPASGSNPGQRRRSASIDNAIDNAIAAVGL
jgi:DNA-binding transcriptional MerR regulator